MSEALGTLAPTQAEINRPDSLANSMKSIRKAKLQREVLADPGLARELVAVQATGTYNANGEVIQAVSGDLGDA